MPVARRRTYADTAAPALAATAVAGTSKVVQTDGLMLRAVERQPPGPGEGADPGLCTLALLNSGRTKDDPAVAKALAYLERKSNPGRTYSASLMIMAFAQADPENKKLTITRLANWLEAHQIRDNDTKGGWTYSERGGRADNSNSQFALLGLHEAERVGARVSPSRTPRAMVAQAFGRYRLNCRYWPTPLRPREIHQSRS